MPPAGRTERQEHADLEQEQHPVPAGEPLEPADPGPRVGGPGRRDQGEAPTGDDRVPAGDLAHLTAEPAAAAEPGQGDQAAGPGADAGQVQPPRRHDQLVVGGAGGVAGEGQGHQRDDPERGCGAGADGSADGGRQHRDHGHDADLDGHLAPDRDLRGVLPQSGSEAGVGEREHHHVGRAEHEDGDARERPDHRRDVAQRAGAGPGGVVGGDEGGRGEQPSDRDGGGAVVHRPCHRVPPAHEDPGVTELRRCRGAGDDRTGDGGHHRDDAGSGESRCGRAVHRRNQRRTVSTATASRAASTRPMTSGPDETGASGTSSPGASTV